MSETKTPDMKTVAVRLPTVLLVHILKFMTSSMIVISDMMLLSKEVRKEIKKERTHWKIGARLSSTMRVVNRNPVISHVVISSGSYYETHAFGRDFHFTKHVTAYTLIPDPCSTTRSLTLVGDQNSVFQGDTSQIVLPWLNSVTSVIQWPLCNMPSLQVAAMQPQDLLRLAPQNRRLVRLQLIITRKSFKELSDPVILGRLAEVTSQISVGTLTITTCSEFFEECKDEKRTVVLPKLFSLKLFPGIKARVVKFTHCTVVKENLDGLRETGAVGLDLTEALCSAKELKEVDWLPITFHCRTQPFFVEGYLPNATLEGCNPKCPHSLALWTTMEKQPSLLDWGCWGAGTLSRYFAHLVLKPIGLWEMKTEKLSQRRKVTSPWSQGFRLITWDLNTSTWEAVKYDRIPMHVEAASVSTRLESFNPLRMENLLKIE